MRRASVRAQCGAAAQMFSVNYKRAPPKQWKTDLEKKVVRIFLTSLGEWGLGKKRRKKKHEDGWGTAITQRAAGL